MIEGRLLRAATGAGVPREQLLSAWTGRECVEGWPGDGYRSNQWRKMMAQNATEIDDILGKIRLLSMTSGFRCRIP